MTVLGGYFHCGRFANCYVVLHFLMCFSFSNCVRLRYNQLSLGNRVATFLGKSCRLCLPPVHFMAAYCICLSFPLVFGV